MTTKKILGVIFGLVFIGAFAFVLTWGILNWQQVKDGMSGSGLYTQEDLNNAYDDGYNSALKDKSEYDELVNGYRDEITRLIDENSKANSNYNDLQKENKSLQANISSLESAKSGLQEQVKNYENQVQTLNSTIAENNTKISDYENQISQKEKEIERLKISGTSKDSEISNLNVQITSLRSQISSLQTVTSQLESTNQANLTTISNLNAQIVSLNAQIVTLQNQYQGNQDTISALNDKIKQLEKSIEYYEQFIANLESGENVVATFEFNGSVYSIQILQKGGKVLFPTPESTTYAIFNYWQTESGEKVQDTSSYTISENTKFVANVTLKFDVKFSVDGVVRESQIVENGQKPSLPSETPSKAGYDFDGWTLNGVDIVDPTQQSVTQNTTYIAKFTQKFTVNFMYESETKSTQEVRSGGHAQNVEIESTTYKKFNGWKVNGEIVNVEDYEIVGATTFVADITYYYDVKFMVNGEQYGQTQTIEAGKFASVPGDPSMAGYDFMGWTVNGSDMVDVASYSVNTTTTFTAKFVSFKFESIEINFPTRANNILFQDKFNAYYVWSDGVNTYFSRYVSSSKRSINLVFDHESLTWKEKKWNGFENLSGEYVWSDGENVYYSAYSTQYVLNKETDTWEVKTWNGFSEIDGQHIWTDGENVYYSSATNQYVLNKDSDTWEVKTWNGFNNIFGEYVWTDGTNLYYSLNNSSAQYVLNVETSTWEEKIWDGFAPAYGDSIWNYNNNVYYSLNDVNYVLDKKTGKWVEMNWSGLPESFNSSLKNRWTCGDDVYVAFYDSGKYVSYVLTRSEI